LQSNGANWAVIARARAGDDVVLGGYFSGAALDIVLTPWLSKYKTFKFRLHNAVSSASSDVYFRVSTDGGSSFASAGYIATFRYTSNLSSFAGGLWGGLTVTSGMDIGWWQAGNDHFFSEVVLSNPDQAIYPMMRARADIRWNTSEEASLLLASCVYPVSVDVDAVRFVGTAGNLSCFYSVTGQR